MRGPFGHYSEVTRRYLVLIDIYSSQMAHLRVIDHPLVPVNLLIFGVQACVTSLTCLVDVWSWEDRSTDEKVQITYLYGPYVALGMYTPSIPNLPC